MLEKYHGKKILILGAGLEGKATFSFLKKHGFQPDVADVLEEKAFFEINPEMKAEQFAYFGGQNYLEKVFSYELIFRTPGISPLLPQLSKAAGRGIEVTSQIQLFMELCPALTIGVTGTKGKGTTTTLIYEILKTSGKKAFIGGNVGLPAITFLDQLDENSFVVLELSSFQLMDLRRSPQVAVVLNISQDHLDYHQTRDEYVEAKSSILRYQTEEDFAVLNYDYETPKSFSRLTRGKVLGVKTHGETVEEGCFVDENDNVVLKSASGSVKIINFSQLPLRGRHNLENVCAAVAAAAATGADQEAIKEAVRNFKGLEHRLEFVAEIEGVKYYNDSFSTVPETAIAALESFEQPIVLIAGGSEKGSDYTALGKKIDERVKTVFLIGEMAQRIRAAIPPKAKVEIVEGMTKMDQIVPAAARKAKTGDVVLLSPACASFGLFKNYKERGQLFKDAVFALKNFPA